MPPSLNNQTTLSNDTIDQVNRRRKKKSKRDNRRNNNNNEYSQPLSGDTSEEILEDSDEH